MKSKIFKIIIILLLICATCVYCSYIRSQNKVITGETMNTYYRIAIRAGQDDSLLHKKIKSELQKINEEMSVFEPMSDISQFNRNTDSGWIDIEAELAEVLKEAHRVYQQTNGNYDPSVDKLIELWGFGTNKVHRIPSQEEIEETKKNIGFNKLTFSKDYRKVKKETPELSLNLSSLAKGYAVDRIVKLLEAEGYKNFIVDIGGEVRAVGNRAKKIKGWNVGVAKPDSEGVNNYEYIVRLQNMSVATSGDYRNYFYIDGKRYSHTINPKTGYPVEYNLASVTVFDKDCMRADALATGIMAMGEVKGLEFANNYRIPVILFVRNENGIQVLISNEGKKFLQNNMIQENTSEAAK